MALKASDLAALVDGTLVGDGSLPIEGVAPLDTAEATQLSFLASGRYLEEFHGSKAGAVLCTAEHERTAPGPATRIIVQDPHRAMLRAVRVLFPDQPAPFVHPAAVIGRGARLGQRVTLHAGCVVGAQAVVGDDCVLHPHVVLYPRTVLGHRVVVHAGSRLGVDGFGYVPGPAGHEKIPHVGRVVVGDDVEIGANCAIDRGSIGDTTIGDGTKIDNLVHIGHGCRIGKRCLIMAQVGLAGSVTIEDEAILAGQAGVSGHLTIGRRARVGGQGGVIGDIEPGATVSGYPARSHREVLRNTAALARLAKIVDEIEAIVRGHG